MQDLHALKRQENTETPLFLFECRMQSGVVERWSTHGAAVAGAAYAARVLSHNLFELKSSLDDGADMAARISLVLANADSYFSQLEWNGGFKGAQLTVRFVFYDLRRGEAVTEPRVVFRGVAGAPDEITETTLRVTFTNRLNLNRVLLPDVRIQRRCPWAFPKTAEQRRESMAGGRFFRCGYSAGETGGQGNLAGDGRPFAACDYTRAQCEERGMFDRDAAGNVTRRFGGIEFVPASVLVRSFGEKGMHASPVLENQGRYNDFVPLVYGTAWYEPPVVFARNDGNLTRFEVLLGSGEMERVVKVVVNDIEIPEAVAGANMTGTGWFSVVSAGERCGAFNSDFADGAGKPIGDPYGSMAYLSVAVPNRISNGGSIPRMQVLAQGLRLERFDESGEPIERAFTNNPAWVLLDVLRRSGWALEDLDVASFARTAAYCEEAVPAKDNYANDVLIPRYQCNLAIRRRRSAADVVRCVRNASGLMLGLGANGRMVLRAEGPLSVQQKDRPEGSNSTAELNGGWPVFEFSDESAAFSGILRKRSGEPHFRLWSRPAADTPNRLTAEFQDEFNEYQQDSLSLVDGDDAALMGQEIAATAAVLGLPNFDQAARMLRLQLAKMVAGNLYVEFATSVRGFGLAPGDLIAVTYTKEGLVRQPFRIVRVAPSLNYATVLITAQYHDDAWYGGTADAAHRGRRQPAFGVGIPRPLLGTIPDENGRLRYKITERARQSADGSYAVALSVGFAAPARTDSSAIGTPSLSLTADLEAGAGGLEGGTTLYYAVSAVDDKGREGPLSFTVRAALGASSDGYAVALRSLSFPANAASFRVYRGLTPFELIRIASEVAIAASFTDDGISPDAAIGPPDDNYDHANFYWRLELAPECEATAYSTNTIGSETLRMIANENRGATVRIAAGRGAGQERTATANDATVLTVAPKWDVIPDESSRFVVAEASWRFGALTVQGPAEFEIPNRKDATVHVMGRAANVHDQECAAELSVLTRWRIGGAGDVAMDEDVPPAPIFGLIPVGRGSVELAGIGFEDGANTRTISAGTLTLLYWDELAGSPGQWLTSAMDEASGDLELTLAEALVAGDVIQVDAEVMIVDQVEGARASVQRGAFGCSAATHEAGAMVYRLSRRSYVVPFVRDFFGSPASGSYSYPIFLPDVRVAAAELYLTNERGDSPPSRVSFMNRTNAGIRTLSGGQFSMQVDGVLARQIDATPPLMIEDAHAVRDIYAVLREPASGEVRVRVRQDDEEYCELAIPAGETRAVENGWGRSPLKARSELALDIVQVPQAPDAFPGADLTVTLRL